MATEPVYRPVVYTWANPLRWVLLIIAVVLLLLSAFHVGAVTPGGGGQLAGVDLTDLGLAFGFGSFLVP